MSQRYCFGIVILMSWLLCACSKSPTLTPAPAEAPKTASIPARRYEGYPVKVITAINDYTTKIQTGRRSIMPFQSVITVTRTWTPKQVITVAFQGGSNDLRKQIAEAVTPWTDAADVKFDFDEAHRFREWKPTDTKYKADIRIAFQEGDDGGYWSVIGRDSINPSIVKPNQASMNFDGFTEGLPSDAKGVILHEFGHALGFEHEHQNPKSPCQGEFRWQDDPGYIETRDSLKQLIPDGQGHSPGIYSRLEGPLNNWNKEQIDFNLQVLPFTPDLLATALDKQSIMMYSFDPWMFVHGISSPCYTNENVVLSQGDIQAAESVYPREATAAKATASSRVNALREMLNSQSLPADIRSHYTNQLNALAQAH